MWFRGYRSSDQTNQNQDPHNLLVPDPDSSVDEDNVAQVANNSLANPPIEGAEVPGELRGQGHAAVMPTTNYDAHHADDEADNAMDKAINALKNKAWGEDDLNFYFAQIEVQMKKAGVKSNFTNPAQQFQSLQAQVAALAKSFGQGRGGR